MGKRLLLSMRQICKAFHGVKALENVDFSLRSGEIHALLGENGAGKSTLMKILCGIYSSDSGQIFIDGEEKSITSPAIAKNYGIGIVHQELMLAPDLTVAENIFLGREPKRWGLLDWRTMKEDAASLLQELRFSLSPSALVQDLTVAQKQLVEIAKVMSQKPRILIMDEPTSALTDSEVEHLFDRLETLRQTGIGIIYISHKMDEVKRIADRVTVLRDGHFIGTLEKGEIDIPTIIKMMVGRSDVVSFQRNRAFQSEERVLEVRGLTNSRVRDISFELRKGEILGFAGLMGAGRTETMRALFGIDPVDSGEVFINGKKCVVKHPHRMKSLGVGFAPEDRRDQALFLDMTVWENVSIAQLYRRKSGLRNVLEEKSLAKQYKQMLDIQTPTVHQEMKKLSGGNQQKVVISRWLANNPDILILDEPTRGIDVGAKSEIYEILSNLSKRGVSIIVVSSELPELLAIADRIIIMHEGRISGEVDAAVATQEKIMAYATGQ
jgi:ribose transport system ATP-binding protein